MSKNNYIQYNSIVTFSILSKDYEKTKYSKYLIAEENLDHTLSFKLCKKPLLEYSDLQESLFYIRKEDECISNYGFSENENIKKFNKEENISKELGFISKENIHQNSYFYLQHMASKKFVSIETTQDNIIILKLLKHIDNAATFLFRKVNKKKNSKEFFCPTDIFYLTLYIKEEDHFYYIQDEKHPVNKNNNKYFNIIIGKNPITQFYYINQNWSIKDSRSIYSGQLINIIFSYIEDNKEEQYMLSVEKKEFKNQNIIHTNEENINNLNNYRIVGIPYSNELYEHVLRNSFWIIEEQIDYFNESNKKPIKTKDYIRIKNYQTGLYLNIGIKSNYDYNNNDSKSDENSYYFLENKKFQFNLVEEKELNDSLYSEYNFLFFNYMSDSLSSEIVDDGKYLLKGVFRKSRINNIKELDYFYQSISLTFDKKNNLIIKYDDDFIFKIKRIDMNQGNQVIYVKKIIFLLNQEVNKIKLNISIINRSIKFFLEYLLNIDYSYLDGNYEYNVPIRERQNVLFRFNIVETVANLIENYLKKIEDEGEIFLTEYVKEMLNELLIVVIKFFKFLSVDNEEIKQSIYIVALNKLLKLAELINFEDITILINFIFDLIDDSEALQDYLLGGGGLLKKETLNNENLCKYNFSDLLRENKLFQYIEKNYNYLVCYEKLIELNKVQYKRKEIISLVKKHMEEVKNKKNPNIANYKRILNDVVAKVITYIVKHAILIERFKKEEEENLNNNEDNNIKKKKTWRKFEIKNNIRDSLIRRKDEEITKNKKSILNDIIQSNSNKSNNNNSNNLINDSSKNNTLISFLKNNKNNINEEINKKTDNNKVDIISSVNDLITSENDNNINSQKVNLISNESSDSSRLLFDTKFNFDKIKSQFGKNENLVNNMEARKTASFMNSNLLSAILKRKTKKLERIRTLVPDGINQKDTLKSDISDLYQIYLNKLAKICVFIKYFIDFDLDNALFVQDNFINDIFKNGIKVEDFENPLYLFFVGKDSSQSNKNWFFDSNVVILYLFHLYNMLFPSIKSDLKSKIKNNIPISGEDILEEIKNYNNNNDNNYSEIKDKAIYEQELNKDFEFLDEYLCILYSLYQFCINQYVKTVHELSKIISVFFMNFSKKETLNKLKKSFKETLIILLSNVVFMKNEIMEKIYLETMSNPSLLNNEVDINNLFTFQNESKNKKNKGKDKNKKNKVRQFSNKESLLIEYLFYFAKKCDQIKYLYEKIVIYRYLKDLINDQNSRLILKDEFDSEVEKQLLNIIKIINYKKLKILLLYEQLTNLNTKYSLEHNQNSKEDIESYENFNSEDSENDNFLVFKVSKRTEIIIKLLRKYELEIFFNNIIYWESQETYILTDKNIKKIRKLKEHFYQIENEVQIIRINLGKNINLNETDNRITINSEESNQKSFESLNKHLGQICSESGKILNMNSFVYKRKDKICQLLSMENKTFYEKIRFNKVLKYMIDSITYYKGEKNETILLYCSYILKIFNDMKNIDYDFHKNIVEYYKMYGSMVLKSLKCISKFPKNKVGEKEQFFFLKISYYGISAFLLILKNCKLYFNEVKDFMENVFKELKNIFNQFHNGKSKIIYQILYTYAVTRVLLFLNKKKNYDSYSYDVFYKFIFPIEKMSENISFCVQTINNNSNREHIISRENTNIFDKERIFNEEENETLSLILPDDEKEPLVVQNLNSKIIPMDLSNIKPNLIDTKISQEKANPQKEIEREKSYDDFIRWDDENEFNRLSFYLNFLSIYVIYINDKNSLLQDEDKFSKLEKIEKEDFSFNTLYYKIRTLLDSNYNYYSNLKDETNNLITSQIDNTLIKEEKLYFKEYLASKNKEYKFHSVLLESILSYRASLNGKNIEIPVVKAKPKNEDVLNETQKNKTQVEDLFIKKNNNSIIYYYYNPEYIDIILLEKILNTIELKEDLMNYCLEEFHSEKNNPALLEILFKNKDYYKFIENYYDEEFNLIHNHFIKNNMEILIKKILNSFDSNDLIEIESMQYYLFKRMGEIYSDYDIKNEENLKKNYSLVQFLSENELNIQTDLNKINLLTFLDSLVYIYPKYSKSIGILYYKIGFKLLKDKCDKDIKSEVKVDEDNNILIEKINLESTTRILILLFSRKKNRELIEDKKVFPIMLNSIRVYFSYISLKGGGFIFKNVELLKEIFIKLDFIFEHLSNDFEKISLFMKNPNNSKNINKFIKKRERLENLLGFLTVFLEFKKISEENLLSEEIFKFISELVEKIIKLLFDLLEIRNRINSYIIDILIDFLFNFIKGPDIKCLNLLFSLGFFNLVTFVIKNIDYYKIFLSYLNKDNMHEVIDNSIKIECKIIKIFIIYYNEAHGNYNNNIEEFEKLEHWYEENFKYIRNKLKKLYYISQKEMKGREYDINKMLLFIKSDDNYNEFELKCRGGKFMKTSDIGGLYQIEKSKNKKKEKERNSEQNKNFCIIKFDLLLLYYTLYNYHKDLSTQTKENNLIQRKNKNLFYSIIIFFFDLLYFLISLILFVFSIVYFFVKKFSSKAKKDVDLLQELTNIDTKSLLIDDQKMIDFLKMYIRELEVSIKNTIYKIYFPMIDKSNTIEEYKGEYYKVEEIDSSEFINYLLINYDKINIRANQYVMINKILKLPIINFIFKKMYVYAILLIILGTISNLLIMLSYSTFNDECNENDKINNISNTLVDIRLKCPHFLYKIQNKTETILLVLTIFGFIELILQFLIFVDYIIRIFSVEQALCKLNYKLKRIRKSKEIGDGKIKCSSLLYEIIPKTMFKCIINFRTFYYILSIVFIILGLKIHPFFNCITLLEFVNRIQLMQTVLKAMYKPLKNILITLLMFIILEYFFSLFAVSYYNTHFPNETDTKNFLKTFMRMMDQTFKQDGGIGTYLNKALDIGYVPYSTTAYFNSRFFFDLLFFLLILLLIFQMFLSTIIDYFNDTRENTENFKEGLETQCSVCGMEREKIEKLYSNDKNAFDNHINIYHNVFNYVYYLMYLQSSSLKDEIIESTIWNLHLTKNLSYLPKNVCFKQFEKRCWEKLNQRKNEEEEE